MAQLACPYCRGVVEVPDQVLGREVVCPYCRRAFASVPPAAPPRPVPPPPAANPFAFDDVADDAPRGDRRRSDSGDRRRNVPNNMVWAVLSTLFCCLPLGLVAILQAAKVNGLARQGKYREAQKAANSAKTLSMAGAVASVVVWVASVGVGVAMAYLAPQQPPDGKPQFNFNPKGQEGRPPAR